MYKHFRSTYFINFIEQIYARVFCGGPNIIGVRCVNGGGPSALCGGGPKKRGPFLLVGNMLISRGSNLKMF